VGEPASPSSSERWASIVLVLIRADGSDVIEGRRGLPGNARLSGGCWLMVLAGSLGMARELEEDWADGRVMDSFFMFRRERGFSDGATDGMERPESEVVGERAELADEVSPMARIMWGF
jgi:hypothetical protein